MTLVELLVVLAVIAVLGALILPPMMSRARIYGGPNCLSNLRQTGLAFRIWEGDNNDKYPMAVAATNGGAMEFTSGPNAFRIFQVMSNQLSTPKVLICPGETDKDRFLATNFVALCNSNISYFVDVDASGEMNPQMILSGDHNITNGTPIRNGLLRLTTNRLAGWTAEVHNKVGNILMADGSVQQDSTTGLQNQIADTGVVTNRLLMPILGP